MTTSQTGVPSSAFSCSTCSLVFESDLHYKEHFKSEYHRYNIKRKLINLPAVTSSQYELQFEQSTNKSASQSDLRCEICSKSFLSPSTYGQHISSQKHKENRKKLLNRDGKKMAKSRSASSSEFSVLSVDSSEKDRVQESCIFCKKDSTDKHLSSHNFPPFKQNCTDVAGLKGYIKSKIEGGHCVYCEMTFTSQQAARQHMSDIGHGKMNIEKFDEYAPYYVWKIEEEEEDSESWSDEEEADQQYQLPEKPTLRDIEEYYASKIVLTPYGARIRGNRREIGVRRYRQFYRQYYRDVQPVERRPKQLQISNGDENKYHRFELMKLTQPKFEAPKRVVRNARSVRTNY